MPDVNMKTEDKTKLRKVKTVGRKLEMTIESFGLPRGQILQFVRDVEVYGLYEACLYLQDTLNEEQYRELIETALEQK